MVKQVVLEVMSARRPKVKQVVDIVIPRMVRNWRCQPKESFYGILACVCR
jgi:hypothetical protein